MVRLKKTLFVIVSVILSGAVSAAERLSTDELQERFSKQKSVKDLPELALTNDAKWQLKLLKSEQESELTYHTYQQFYHGIPVWNKQVIVAASKNGNFKQSYGEMFKGMAADLKKSIQYEQRSADTAKQLFLNSIQSNNKEFVKSSAEKVIFMDENDRAHFAYKIQWMTVQNNGKTKIEKTLTIVDQNLSVLATYDALQHATLEGGSGPSGNNKMPREDHLQEGYQAYPPTTFVVAQTDNGQGMSTCQFDALDVDTRNAKHDIQTPAETYSYDCTESTFNDFKAYNTAKSPLNDAHHYAQATQLMFQDYLDLKAFNNEKIIQNVHFGQNMDQAFYEDGQVYYGDGDILFYPMVALDVVAHEIAHGFTEEFGTNSKKQMLTGQARAINEAFSDIAGEAVEYFLRGENDWRANYDAYQFEGALRYFAQPTQDGASIDHVKDYDSTVSAHHGAGIFNKAFYQLLTQSVDSVESNPWTPKTGFVVFAKANRHCWTATSTFQEAAQCVLNQASSAANSMAADQILKSDDQAWQSVELKNHIRKAFAQVGINLVVGAGIESDFSISQSFLSAQFNNITRKGGQQITSADNDWQWLWSFGELDAQGGEITSTQFSPSHTYKAAGNYPVSLIATAPNGNQDTYQIVLNTWSDYCAVSGGNEDRYFIDAVTINNQTNPSGSSTYSNYTAELKEVKME
jgi:vibriolysin